MAFGARELRLILSIQSYGTGNLTRLRRDIASLGAATKAANAEQLANARKISQLQTRRFATQGIAPLRQQRQLTSQLLASRTRMAEIEKSLGLSSAQMTRNIRQQVSWSKQMTVYQRQMVEEYATELQNV